MAEHTQANCLSLIECERVRLGLIRIASDVHVSSLLYGLCVCLCVTFHEKEPNERRTIFCQQERKT